MGVYCGVNVKYVFHLLSTINIKMIEILRSQRIRCHNYNTIYFKNMFSYIDIAQIIERDFCTSQIQLGCHLLNNINHFQKFKFDLYNGNSVNKVVFFFQISRCSIVHHLMSGAFCLLQVRCFNDHHCWLKVAAIIFQQSYIPVCHSHLYCALFQI